MAGQSLDPPHLQPQQLWQAQQQIQPTPQQTQQLHTLDQIHQQLETLQQEQQQLQAQQPMQQGSQDQQQWLSQLQAMQQKQQNEFKAQQLIHLRQFSALQKIQNLQAQQQIQQQPHTQQQIQPLWALKVMKYQLHALDQIQQQLQTHEQIQPHPQALLQHQVHKQIQQQMEALQQIVQLQESHQLQSQQQHNAQQQMQQQLQAQQQSQLNQHMPRYTHAMNVNTGPHVPLPTMQNIPGGSGVDGQNVFQQQPQLKNMHLENSQQRTAMIFHQNFQPQQQPSKPVSLRSNAAAQQGDMGVSGQADHLVRQRHSSVASVHQRTLWKGPKNQVAFGGGKAAFQRGAKKETSRRRDGYPGQQTHRPQVPQATEMQPQLPPPGLDQLFTPQQEIPSDRGTGQQASNNEQPQLNQDIIDTNVRLSNVDAFNESSQPYGAGGSDPDAGLALSSTSQPAQMSGAIRPSNTSTSNQRLPSSAILDRQRNPLTDRHLQSTSRSRSRSPLHESSGRSSASFSDSDVIVIVLDSD